MREYWGKGIPEYASNDLMTKQEIHKFAIESALPFILKEGYELVAVKMEIDAIPSLVLRKGSLLYFALIRTEIAMKRASVSEEEKQILINHSKKYDAIPVFVPIEIGSFDGERFSIGLALKHDGYYINYTGIQDLREQNPLR